VTESNSTNDTDDGYDPDAYCAGGSCVESLYNHMHYKYIGPLSFGEYDSTYPRSQDALVVYDTGSAWVTVTSSDCRNCPLMVYNESASIKAQADDLEPHHENYYQGYIIGHRVDD